MITCLNCGCSYEGKYCPECGQKGAVKRLNASLLIEDILHFFTHFEKGFLQTSWSFIVRPGITSLNFLSGKRKRYQPPVSYFFIWTSLYILFHNFLVSRFGYHLSAETLAQMNLRDQANAMLRTHFTPFILPILFLSGLVIYPILARPKLNLTEVFVLCLYGGGTYFMMLFFSDIIFGFILRVNIVSSTTFLSQTILATVYNFWFSYDIFKKMQLRFFWLRLFAVAFLVGGIGMSMMFYLPMVIVRFFE